MTDNAKIDQLPFASHGDPFPIPTTWSWKPLSKALTHRREYIEIDDGVCYQRVKVQLHGRGIVPRDIVPGAEIKTKKQKVLKANDFLVAEIDAKMGGFGIVPSALTGAIVSSHYFTFELDAEQLLPEYLAAFIRVGYITKGIELSVRGSLNYAAIRPAHILKMPFPFAPLPAQRDIIESMDAAQAAVLAAQHQLETLQSLPGAILRASINWSTHNG